MPARWTTFAFRDFLKPNLRPFTLGADQDADLVGVKWYGEGPFHRERKSAISIAKKSHFLIRSGDVIYNKLFAWKGTFGIVPDALDGMFVSDKFPTYALNRERVSDRYLRWYFRLPELWERAREKSTGSAAVSKLTLNPPRFLDLELRAPVEVQAQNAIADRFDAAAAAISEIRQLKTAAQTEVRALLTATINEELEAIPADGRLERVLAGKPRNGWSPRCDNIETGIPVLTLSAVTGFQYRPTAFKRTSEPVDESAHYWLQADDLLMSRSNTLELVGHASMYTGDPSPCIYPDLLMRLTVDASAASKRFVWYWLQTHRCRRFVESKAKGTSSTMKKISQGVVCAIPFPATLSVQSQTAIVGRLDDRLTKINAAIAGMADWQQEVDALIPSLLTKELGS